MNDYMLLGIYFVVGVLLAGAGAYENKKLGRQPSPHRVGGFVILWPLVTFGISILLLAWVIGVALDSASKKLYALSHKESK